MFWNNMPEFNNKTVGDKYTIQFLTVEDRKQFEKKNNINFEKHKTIWYPKPPASKHSYFYTTDNDYKNKYPIYIISKGRAESRLTVKALNKCNIDYKIFVEPQELNDYRKYIPDDNIIVLPFSNLGQGSIPARNFVWEYSIKMGDKKHWILDDNIRNFKRFNLNYKMKCNNGNFFRVMENFTDRCRNVKMSGPHYTFFQPQNRITAPPYYANTRVYSCILLDNELYPKFKWRGKFNEDTDLSIRILKAGYGTILFNAFLIEKPTTMTMKGGNADIYKNGREEFVDSLVEQHPDCVKKIKRFNRFHHWVDYSQFKDNAFSYEEQKEEGINEMGFILKKNK